MLLLLLKYVVPVVPQALCVSNNFAGNAHAGAPVQTSSRKRSVCISFRKSLGRLLVCANGLQWCGAVSRIEKYTLKIFRKEYRRTTHSFLRRVQMQNHNGMLHMVGQVNSDISSIEYYTLLDGRFDVFNVLSCRKIVKLLLKRGFIERNTSLAVPVTCIPVGASPLNKGAAADCIDDLNIVSGTGEYRSLQ
eukprot:Lankesteria_metandrocarpae@DN7659_c0_g1_i1.p1